MVIYNVKKKRKSYKRFSKLRIETNKKGIRNLIFSSNKTNKKCLMNLKFNPFNFKEPPPLPFLKNKNKTDK